MTKHAANMSQMAAHYALVSAKKEGFSLTRVTTAEHPFACQAYHISGYSASRLERIQHMFPIN
jgi:hypothetical protein